MKLICITTGMLLSAGVLFAQTATDTVAVKELSEIIVSGKQHAGYHILTSTTGTRINTLNIAIPQSIQTIPQEIIRDRQAFTLNELSQVIPGVKANNGSGSFSMRGFTGYYPFGSGYLLFDGIRGNLFLWSQQPLLYNIDKVEVLKGPASVLYSESMPGGVINMVTKKPLPEQQLQLEATYGSRDLARFMIDATGPAGRSKHLLYRMIAGYDRSNSFRDYQRQQNLMLAPSFTYLFSDRSRLTAAFTYNYARAVQQYDRGSYVLTRPDGSYDFHTPSNALTPQSPGDYGKLHNLSAAFTFEHQFNSRLKLTVAERYVRNLFDYTDHIPRKSITGDTVERGFQDWRYDQYSWQTTAFLDYTAGNANMRHHLLFGADYNNYGWLKNDYRYAPAPPLNIYRPDYSKDKPETYAYNYFDDNQQRIHLTGFYLSDEITLKRRLILNLGLRYDNYRMKQTPLSEKDATRGSTSEASAFVPRAGLVYRLRQNMSLYGSYSQSFTPQNSNNARNGGPFPPRRASQYEIGYKTALLKNISVTAALYQIDYRNILAPAPTADNPNRQTVIDGSRSRGLELSLQGSWQQFSFIGGYAYNDHTLVADSELGKKGAWFNNAPRHMANGWITYTIDKTLLKGLSIGTGIRYVSEQAGAIAIPAFILPDYTVWDMALGYHFSRFDLRVNMDNITNRHYFTGGFSNTATAALGNPFNMRAGIHVKL